MEIRLYGVLGSRFGRVHHRELETGTVREAVAALEATIGGFGRFMRDSDRQGLTFAIFRGKRNLSEDELELRGEDVIRIAPVIQGSKKGGIFQTILGITLMVSAIWLGPAAFFAGASMALGGVMQMLSPQPTYGSKDDVENTPSYAFGGAVNTVAQGNPVGLLYGRRRVGGAVVSAGVYSEDTL